MRPAQIHLHPRSPAGLRRWARCLLAPAAALLWTFAAGAAEDYLRFPEGTEFLPASWTAPPIEAEIERVDPAGRDQAREILLRAFAKYPDRVLRENLGGVYVVGSLKFYGVAYGGTYMANARRIVLVYRDTFDEVGFEQRFHHEFSSILLKRYQASFDEARWTLGNPEGFAYRAEGIIEEQSGDRSEATRVLEEEQQRTGGSGSSLLQLNPKLMAEGFLTAYNRVSVEQDVNETAAHLFTNDDLWTYARRFPLLDQKVDVLIDFYRAVDPSFDRLYFRRLTERARHGALPESATPSSTPAAPTAPTAPATAP